MRAFLVVCILSVFGLSTAAAQAPAGSASVKPSGGSLGRIRLGAADPLWFNWQIGVRANAFKQLTFVDAAVKADALGLGSIVGSSDQQAAYEIPKKLNYKLQAGERKAILAKLRELNVRMPAYQTGLTGPDDASWRKLFEFAKEMGVQTIVSAADPAAFPSIDKLAAEFGINVAATSKLHPAALSTALEGRNRIGVFADIAEWESQGVKPSEGLQILKTKVMGLNLGGRAASASDMLLQAFRLELKPLFIAVDPAGVDALEKALQPAMAARVRQVVDSPHGAIRGPERLAPEMRQQIEAAIPAQAPAKPKKARRMLVLDLNMWSGHATIPHGNYLLGLFGKKLGIYDATFSNDLNNLKYPRIKEYDAVFLNNVVGMVFPDPEVREGLIRYVREGGGLGGVHGTTYAALDSPEFTDMLGGFAGEHHVEKQMLKIDDPGSPLTKAFGGKPLEHTDEFYHFPASSPYSREKSRVLLSIDVENSDLATNGRLCAKCTRPDHDYAMSWIKSYGKGRVFCTPLGHTTILFTDKRWVEHLLAGVQFILGDLEADTTPSAKAAARKK
jgi:hypothetical protein